MLTRRKFLSYLFGASAVGLVVSASPPSVGFLQNIGYKLKDGGSVSSGIKNA